MSTALLVAVIAVLLLAAGATFVRLVVGPSVPDRIIAANSVGLMLFSLIVVFALVFDTDSFLDIALVYSVLQFVDIMILTKYLNRQKGYQNE